MIVSRLIAGLAVAFSLSGAGSLAASAAAADDRVDALIAVSRAALGGSALDRPMIVRLDANVKTAGLTGTGTAWLELGRRRYSERSTTPPLINADGFDGEVAWNRDGSGLVWVDGGQAGRAGAISSAFVNDDALWSPNHGGAAVVWAGTKSAGATTYDVLTVTAPGSAVPFDLWFDRATHLPSRFVQAIGPMSTTQTFGDYRPVHGLLIPFAIHVETSDGNTDDETVTGATVDPADGEMHLAKPVSAVSDFSIAHGATETSVPFDLVENHVYLSLMLNGHGPYRFIYDTGGSNVVDPAVAKEIGATGSGSMQGSGVGAATESLSFAKVDAVTVGAATVRKQLFAVAPTRSGFGMAGGRPVDGLIGFEVLSRFVTTFDYGARNVVLHMPQSAQVPPGAVVVPFVLNGQQPQFACSIDSIAGQCTLDTGARDSISLMSPFIAAHPQIVPKVMSASGVTGFGFGGPAYGRLGRLQSVDIGGFSVPNVVADFTSQEKGALAVPFLAANVGGNLLRRFNLQLDYGKQTLALVPNVAYREPDSYERSGLFLLRRGGNIVVLDVRAGTAAERAGLHIGDRVDTVDGLSVTALSLQEVREHFFAAPGTVVQLGVTPKDGRPHTVSLTLSDFV